MPGIQPSGTSENQRYPVEGGSNTPPPHAMLPQLETKSMKPPESFVNLGGGGGVLKPEVAVEGGCSHSVLV